MIYEVNNKSILEKIKPLFNQIRFYMGNSVLDGLMGKAYVDDLNNPQIAFLMVRNYCFISGNIDDNELKSIIDNYFINKKLIPSDDIADQIEKIYSNNVKKLKRYSLKKEVVFDKEQLNNMIESIDKKYNIVKIDEKLANKIGEIDFLTLTDDYKKNGVGFCCIYQDEIIGVASSNIIYKNGIEVNIKVDERYRKEGIGSAMAARLILECMNQGKKVSWDAANTISVKLAKKLGFEYDSPYAVYKLKKAYKPS